MSEYAGRLGVHIEAMLDYREALGYSRKSRQYELANLARFWDENYQGEDNLTNERVWAWLDCQQGNLREKAEAARMLGRYMESIGIKSYVIPDDIISNYRHQIFAPYIFTDSELYSLFRAADKIKPTENQPFLHEIIPVMFRLIYTCGLRPNEGRELKTEFVNLKSGEIFITNTKKKKERMIVMSEDMRELCKKYDERREIFAYKNEYFFPSWNGGSFSTSNINKYINDCWKRANPKIKESKLPRIRAYDLRHRFASAALNRWLDSGENLAAKLPYLRAYMGHDTLSETAHYIHILPENLVKSAGIDWDALNGIIPEVKTW